jgi:NAD(P)H-dependent FMN reductase
MNSITIISGTNRLDSNTEKIADFYLNVLKKKGVDAQLFNLKDLPSSFISSELYGNRSPEFQHVIDNFIEKQTKFIFISPEYNGSFPGVLKAFLDAVHPKYWENNKACLVGVSSGRAGNLRGMEHLTNILNYLKINVYHNKLPISLVSNLLNESKQLADLETQKVIDVQLDGFLNF